jgi:hypothetical protein
MQVSILAVCQIFKSNIVRKRGAIVRPNWPNLPVLPEDESICPTAASLILPIRTDPIGKNDDSAGQIVTLSVYAGH